MGWVLAIVALAVFVAGLAFESWPVIGLALLIWIGGMAILFASRAGDDQ